MGRVPLLEGRQLPYDFSKRMFDATKLGPLCMRVVPWTGCEVVGRKTFLPICALARLGDSSLKACHLARPEGFSFFFFKFHL